MSKTFLTFFVCFFFFFVLLRQTNAAPTDPVSIPDAALRAAIETKLGKNAGDTITESDMNGMTGEFKVNNMSVSDLTGLEHATRITEFKIQNNRGEITDISPVEDLTQLAILSIHNYKIASRDPPAALSDISPVTKLIGLEELRLDHGIIVDISPVADLTNLRTLNFQRNNIVDISPLAKLTRLKYLNLRQNKLTSLGTSLSNLTALTELWLDGNNALSNISVVKNFTNLETLHLEATSITSNDLSAVLPSLSKLKWLYIAFTAISDLSVLGKLPVALTEVLDLQALTSDYNRGWTLARGDGQGRGWLLTDLSPLVSLMNAGNVITMNTRQVDLTWNYALDYESLYTHIPALIAAGISDVKYTTGVPVLARVSAENHVGGPRTRHTFVVRATNSTLDYGDIYINDRFAKVPVTWRVTAPDGTVSEESVLTGDDGLSSWTITLGDVDEQHTIEAIVPANTRAAAEGPSHPELRVTFTATATTLSTTGVSDGGGGPSPLATQSFIFNEVCNAPDDTNDWIELKNLCSVPLRLSDWQILLMTSEEHGPGEEIDVVSFPDVMLPVRSVLLITNTDPRETRLASGLNIGTGARQRGARHLYLVAERLKLPSTPYLLVLQRRAVQNGDPPATIEDVAGNYFRTVPAYHTEVYPLVNTSRPMAAAAPLTTFGVWQRQHLQHPGYLGVAWMPSGFHGGIGYDRDTEVSMSLGTPGYRRDPSPSQPVAHRLVFNEICNAEVDANDWLELKNICSADVRLTDWEISIVAREGTAADEDVDLVSFPDYTLPMGGVLLITNTDPKESVLADGLNIGTGARQRGARHLYLVAPEFKLPSTPYLLLLRHAREKNSTPAAIEDVAGNYFRNSIAEKTEVWPLADTQRPLPESVVPLTTEGPWERRDVYEPGYLAAAWTLSPSTGLGYDRHVLRENALGSPGYGAAGVFNPSLPDEVRFSEVMLETEGPRLRRWRVLPQWIEVYNTSEAPVNLEGYRLTIEARTAEVHQHVSFTLKSVWLPPKQTALLVTGSGRDSVPLLPDRIYDISEVHLGREGFFLKLTHPTGRVVDTCGNLDGDPDTKDPPRWALPACLTPQGHRVSLLRRFAAGDVMKGMEASGWQRTSDVSIAVTHYYGYPTDISTPGGLHQIVPGASPSVTLSISELMFTTGTRPRRPLPQWIELYNPSFVASVNLKGYQCIVETRQSGEPHQIVIDLEAIHVLPNATVLLVTGPGRNSGHFPENRIYNLPERHPRAFESLQQGHHLLSSDGFLLQLTDATGNVVDTVGNLDGYPLTEDSPAWELPMGETAEGARASLRRLYEKGVPLDGRQVEGWVPAAAVPPVTLTYYGDASDVGNPLYRMGGALPVVLSHFGAVRNAADVVVSWTTESSLDNAGFHLYRSEQRTGGFIRVNPRLIQGAGTTAERQTYTYAEQPPKADVAYYYQIQEVSYSGQQQVLATCRVKGHLSAEKKHLTTFGTLKTGK